MRTFEEIRQSIVDEKNIQLADLNSSSKTAIWWLWVNIVAMSIFTFEQIFYTEKELLEKEVELKRYGSLSWYASECLKFQLGDPLVFNSVTGVYSYAVIDPLKQIIKRASVDEGGDDLLFKLAKEVGGSLVPLTASELVLARGYIGEIAVAGIDFDVLSLPSDIVSGVADLYYDANYLLSDIQTAINDVLNAYRDEFPFDGVLLKNKLIDIIRDVDGVDDILFTNLQGVNGVQTPFNIVRDYVTVSGYFNFDPAFVSGFNFLPRHLN